MRTTTRQDTELTDQILDWVVSSVDMEDLYGRESILEYASENFELEDLFTEKELSSWAYDNGFKKFE